MKYKDYLTCLHLARELKELGISQESLFYWQYINDTAYSVEYIPFCVCPLNTPPYQHFSAFTSDELMDLLPARIDIKTKEPFNSFWLEIKKRSVLNIQYLANYICDSQYATAFGINPPDKLRQGNIYDSSLSNCLAKMLIYLVKNNLYVKMEPINIDHLMTMTD